MLSKVRLIYCLAVILGAGTFLVACASLPSEAKQAVLSTFAPDEQPRIHSAHRADPLPEDQALGVEEVWCVNVTHLCYDCARQRMLTCISGRLARRINNTWQVSWIMTEEDWEAWEARGCPREEEVVGEAPP